MAEITLSFNPDGSVEIQDEPGTNAEKNLAWLLKGLGDVSKRGHKHAHTRDEGVQIKQK